MVQRTDAKAAATEAITSDTMAAATRGVARLSRQVELTLGGFQLSVTQFRLLDRLAGGIAAGRSLAEWLAVKPPSVTGLVDVLVTRGLVERSPDADDRRRIRHELTPAGRRLHVEASAALAERLVHLVGFLDDDARGAEIIAALAGWNEAIDLARRAKAENPAQDTV